MKRWYVAIRTDHDNVIRGPYKHAETAAAVRDELEARYPDRNWNLAIIVRDEEDKPDER